jgi:hypothetical protein
MMAQEYYLWMADHPAELAVIIEEKLTDGWELYGNPIVDSCGYRDASGKTCIDRMYGQATIRQQHTK